MQKRSAVISDSHRLFFVFLLTEPAFTGQCLYTGLNC